MLEKLPSLSTLTESPLTVKLTMSDQSSVTVPLTSPVASVDQSPRSGVSTSMVGPLESMRMGPTSSHSSVSSTSTRTVYSPSSQKVR